MLVLRFTIISGKFSSSGAFGFPFVEGRISVVGDGDGADLYIFFGDDQRCVGKNIPPRFMGCNIEKLTFKISSFAPVFGRPME